MEEPAATSAVKTNELQLLEKLSSEENIVAEIAKNLTQNQLLELRECCNLFYKYFSSQITLKINTNSDLNSFVNFHQDPANFPELNPLNKCVYKKIHFNFHLNSEKSYYDNVPSILFPGPFSTLINIVQNAITHLTIRLDINHFKTYKELFKLIAGTLENLNVTIYESPDNNSNSDDEYSSCIVYKSKSKKKKREPPELTLDKLTSLTLEIKQEEFSDHDEENYQEIAESIISFCPNLIKLRYNTECVEEFDNFSILTTNIPQSLKRLVLFSNDEVVGGDYIGKVANKLKLESFGLECETYKIDHLNWRQVYFFVNFLFELAGKEKDFSKCPVFPATKELIFLEESTWRFVPSLSQTLTVFPALKSLSLDINIFIEDDLLKNLKIEKYPTLQSLKINFKKMEVFNDENSGESDKEEEEDSDDDEEKEYIEKIYHIQMAILAKLFPNLIELELSGIINPTFKLEEIWINFPKLEKFVFSPINDEYYITDEDITGIDGDFIKNDLKGKNFEELEKINFGDLPKIKTGIQNIKNLKVLELKTDNDDNCLFGEISFFFGFRFLKNLTTLNSPKAKINANTIVLLMKEFSNLASLKVNFDNISHFSKDKILQKVKYPASYLNKTAELEDEAESDDNHIIFSNNLLLFIIGENLSRKHKANLRLVNKKWYEELTKTIQIKLNPQNLPCFISQHQILMNKQTNFSFYHHFILQLENPSVEIFQDFYQNLEKVFKFSILKGITFELKEIKMEQFFKLISLLSQYYSETLKILKIKIEFKEESKSEELIQNIPVFNSVKYLQIECPDCPDEEIIKKIIRACPHVVTYYLFPLDIHLNEEWFDNFCPVSIRSKSFRNLILNLKCLAAYSSRQNVQFNSDLIHFAQNLSLTSFEIKFHFFDYKIEFNSSKNIYQSYNVAKINVMHSNYSAKLFSIKVNKNISGENEGDFMNIPSLKNIGLNISNEESTGGNSNNINNQFLSKDVTCLGLNIGLQFYSNFLTEIVKYSNLTELSLMTNLNKMKKEEAKSFKIKLNPIYENLPRLTKLYLGNSYLNDEDITGIPGDWAKTNLLKLCDYEFVKNVKLGEIPRKKSGIYELKDLETLEIESEKNKLSKISFYFGFRLLKYLENLTIQKFKMDLISLQIIEEDLPKLNKIKADFDSFSGKRMDIFKAKRPLLEFL